MVYKENERKIAKTENKKQLGNGVMAEEGEEKRTNIWSTMTFPSQSQSNTAEGYCPTSFRAVQRSKHCPVSGLAFLTGVMHEVQIP